MIAIIAALPREVAGLIAGTEADPAYLRQGIALHYVNSTEAVVVTAGMGAARVTLAVQAAIEHCEALRTRPVDVLLSVGLAGSCTPELRPGEVIEAGQVVDARTGERFGTAGESASRLLATGNGIAGVAEKKRLADTYGASMVDMEAAVVARLARARDVSFRAIKAISDAHDFEIESLAKFADERGQFRTAAFALHTAVRPRQWPLAMTLGRNSNAALKALSEKLRDVIAAANTR